MRLCFGASACVVRSMQSSAFMQCFVDNVPKAFVMPCTTYRQPCERMPADEYEHHIFQHISFLQPEEPLAPVTENEVAEQAHSDTSCSASSSELDSCDEENLF